jgi:predicted AAA+ superfamily ATPase
MNSSYPRELEKTIKILLGNFPCVCLLGARQVGKSTLLKKVLPKGKFYDLELDSDFQRINNNPDFFLAETKGPLIIDEAQLSPKLFPALRVAIDRNRDKNGQFLISGSSSPELIRNISESLAGRIASLQVPTFSWDEAQRTASSKFYDYINNPEKFLKLKALYKRNDLYKLCAYGLYPELVTKSKNQIFREQWIENYFKNYIERDIRNLFPNLQMETYKRFIQMLIYANADIINASNFAKSLDVSQPTIKNYLEIVEGTFIWRKLNSYTKNTTKRLIKMPKGHMQDTAFISSKLNINSTEELLNQPSFGKIWESFVIEQLIKKFQVKLIKSNFYFYRTHHQAEIDLIIESKVGLIPIEIKSGTRIENKSLISLKNFIEEHNCKYGIVINNGDEVYKISEKIYVIPAIYL